MPFCSNCGKQLAENEICSCQTVQNNNTASPQPNVNNYVPPQQNVNPVPPPIINKNVNVPPGFQQYDQYGRPLFTPQGQPISYDENGNAIVGGKKKSSGCMIAFVIFLIVFLLIGLILAAILVPAMMGYVNKAKVAHINSEAVTICKAVNAALSDMNYSGVDINGTYIICSEPSLNRTIASESNLDTSTLYSRIGDYYSYSDGYEESYSDGYEWFAVVEYGTVTYCAVKDKNNDKYIGTYPKAADIRQGPASYSGIYAGSDTDLNDLYNSTVSLLN